MKNLGSTDQHFIYTQVPKSQRKVCLKYTNRTWNK